MPRAVPTGASDSQFPASTVRRIDKRVSRLVVGEARPLVIPIEHLTRQAQCNQPEQADLGECPAVIEMRSRLPPIPYRFRPIPRVAFDTRDFFRRRILTRV